MLFANDLAWIIQVRKTVQWKTFKTANFPAVMFHPRPAASVQGLPALITALLGQPASIAAVMINCNIQ